MRERHDPSLEALLAATLAERADRIPATVTLERVQARLEERKGARRRQTVRRPLTLLGVAAAVLLPMAALVIGQRPPAPEPGLTDAYQAIVRRHEGDEWLIVAVRGDGQERVLTSLRYPPDDRRRPRPVVSDDGWLASPASTGWEFRDLRSPDRIIDPIVPFLATESGRAWIGGGRFAAWNEAGEVVLLDPKAGTAERAVLPDPLTHVIAATADGSALVSHGDWGQPIVYWGERRPADWRVLPLDGGTAARPRGDTINGVVPLGDLDIGWRSGTWWRDDGSRVQLCDLASRSECPDLPNGAVVVELPDGTLAPWYTDELAPGDVVDVALGTAGVWLVLDERTGRGRQLTLAHLDAPGTIRTVSTWMSTDAWNPGSIEGVAPDDSLVVAGSLLTDGRTGGSWPLQGEWLGFVPSQVVDTLAGGPLQTAAPLASSAPDRTAYPTLRPLETLLAEHLMPGDRLLWREEHPAVDGPAASPSATVIGPIELDVGLGVLLACSGPSDVLVTIEGPDGPLAIEGPDGQDVDPGSFTPLLSRCLDSDSTAGGSMACCQFSGPVTVTVSSTRNTAWQLVVFDPAPER